METERLRNNINFLRHFVIVKKSLQVCLEVKKQYLSKIDYLSTQKQFLNKLNSLETEKNAAIRENRETIADKKHHIHTVLEENSFTIKEIINFILRILIYETYTSCSWNNSSLSIIKRHSINIK